MSGEYGKHVIVSNRLRLFSEQFVRFLSPKLFLQFTGFLIELEDGPMGR
jgi:hypothetical protein